MRQITGTSSGRFARAAPVMKKSPKDSASHGMMRLALTAIYLCAPAYGLVVAARAAWPGFSCDRTSAPTMRSGDDGLTPEERMRERVRRAQAEREAAAAEYRERVAREEARKAEAEARVRNASEKFGYGLSAADRQKASLEAMFAGSQHERVPTLR